MASKAHRGKTLLNLPAHGRGTCPICNATGIKLLYEVDSDEGKRIKVCKRCHAKKVASK